MRTIFVYIALLISFLGFSQTPLPNNYQITPNGIFDNVYDIEGRKYNLEEIMIDTVTLVNGKPKAALLCTAGYFNLFFEQGSGFDGNTTVENERLNVLCQVFSDISAFITPANQNVRVNIWVRKIQNITTDPNVLGLASSFYSFPNGALSTGGIVENEVWKTINSGIDSYLGVAAPLYSSSSLSAGYYHGIVSLNFSTSTINWHTDLSLSTSVGLYDLYSVVLHEVVHSLGFASLISSNGSSKFNTLGKYYTKYDTYLQTLNNQKLIVNTGNCSLFNFDFNSNLNASVLSPSIFNCNNQIQYSGSISHAVYTPSSFSDPSSLSHFEDRCHNPAYNIGQYFVMSASNGIGPNYMKRFLKPEERSVLCDIGYKVGTTFGNSNNLNYNNYGGNQCPGSPVIGVNDGISSQNTYQYQTVFPAPITISNIWQNDINGASFECLQVVQFGGSSGTGNGNVNQTVGTVFTFTPTAPGLVLLRYIPVSSGGAKGNFAYVYINVTTPEDNCQINSCNLIRNGGFEENQTCGVIDIMNNVNLGCWKRYYLTPDLFVRNCAWSSGSFEETWNNGVNNNNSYIHLYSERVNSVGCGAEGVKTKLNSPLAPNSSVTYILSFRAKAYYLTGTGNNVIPAIIQFGGYNGNQMPSSSYINSFPANVHFLATSPEIPYNNQWNYFSIPITNNLNYALNNLVVLNATSYMQTVFGGSGVFIDDISIVDQSNSPIFNLPTTSCLDQIYPNLLTFTSYNTGSFSGPGVSLNNGIYSFDASQAGIGTHLINYTYTNSSGCKFTVAKSIFVDPILCCLNPVAYISPSQVSPNISSVNNNLVIEVTGQVNLNSNMTFNNCTFKMGSNSKINIGNNSTLTLNGCKLFSCTDLWDGIYVNNGSTIVAQNTRFEDAKFAIYSMNGGKYTIQNCVFNKNSVSIFVDSYSASHLGTVTGTTFECTATGTATTGSSLKNPMFGQKSHFGIYIRNVNSLTIGGINQNANNFNDLEVGIYSDVVLSLNIYKNNFKNIKQPNCYINTNLCNPNLGWPIWCSKTGVIIGTSNGLTGQNKFENCTSGIRIDKASSFGIFYNDFNNINSPGVVGSPIVSKCIFINEVTSSTNINNIKNNTFTNFEKGIYYLKSISSQLIISNNTFGSFNSSALFGNNVGAAIHLLENVSQTINISRNLINSTTQNGDYGIIAQNVGSINTNGSNFTIQQNTIRNVKNGIWITRYNNVKITDHRSTLTSIGTSAAGIYFPSTVPTTTTIGIKLENCNGTLVKGNTIQRTNYTSSSLSGFNELTAGNSQLMYGIYVGENSANSNIIDNTTLKMGTGIYIIGNNNFPTTVRCNQIKFHPVGLHMNGYIGDQGSPTSPQDNQWAFGTSGSIGIVRNGLTPKFHTRSLSLPFMPNPNTQFFPPATAVDYPITTSSNPIYNCQEGCANPPCFIPNGLVQAITESGEYSLLSEQELKTLDIELYKSLKISPYTYDQNTEDGNIYEEFIDSMDLTNAFKIYELEMELALNDTIIAKQKLDAFEAYGDVELNYKKVFEVYINTWMKGKYELESQDSSYLREIADQSPRVAGNAVYMARVMLSIDTTDTETYYAKSTNVQAIKVYEQLKLYPNPGSEFIHYQLPIEESENGIVRIIDISGKLLIEWTVDFNCSIGSLDVSQYSKGIYMFELELTNGKSIIKKLVVE